MKKLLFALFFSITTSCFASQPILFFWPHGIAGTSATYVRAVLNKANANQNKYDFVLMPTFGAGGSIAANKAATTHNAILGASSAFFIRPNLYPTASHDVMVFRMMAPITTSPFALVVGAKADVKTIMSKKPAFFGAAGGLGSTSHVVGTQLKIPGMIVVPYKTDATESLAALYAGQVDMTVSFIDTVHDNPLVKIIGITGVKSVNNYPLLTSLGYSKMDKLSVPVFIVAPTTMPTEQFNELQAILTQAIVNNTELDARLQASFGKRLEIKKTELDRWYNEQIGFYKEVLKDVHVE